MTSIHTFVVRVLLVFGAMFVATAFGQPAVSVSVTGGQISGSGSAVVSLNATGAENNVTFTLSWDPAVLQYVSDTKGTIVSQYVPNRTQTASGKLSVLAAVNSGETYPIGAHSLLTINFTALAASASTPIALIDGSTLSPPLARKRVFDTEGTNLVTATFADANTAVSLPPAAPSITTHPTNQIGNPGGSVTFTAAASGNPAPTYQWKRDTTVLAGKTAASLTLTGLTGADLGTYTVTATNGVGSPAVSNGAILTLNFGIGTFMPTSGSTGTLVTINGVGFTGATAVMFNGLDAASFSIQSDFQIIAQVPTYATTGPIVVTRVGTGATTLVATPAFTVTQGPRLKNVSVLAATLGAEAAMMSSFSIEGTANVEVLVRAAGPALAAAPFNMSGTLADPFVAIYNSSGTQIAFNNDWSSTLAAKFTEVGAFPFTAGSKDAALAAILPPGTYTARVTGVGGVTGITLLEVYEQAAPPAESRIPHLSARQQIAAGGTSSTGFVLAGTGGKTLLFRAVGAGLGVTGALANPTLSVFQGPNSIGTNDNFGTSSNLAAINAATAIVGAMPLGANDSAILFTCAPGNYTLQVSGVGGTGGIVMTEVFVVDGLRAAAFPPALLAPLHPLAIDINGTLALSAPFVGKPAPTFQWQKEGADLSDQTNAVLTISSFSGAKAGNYRVILTNASATVTSAVAAITVNKASPGVQWSTPAPITFGTPLASPPVSGAQLNAMAAVPGTFVYTPAAGTILNAGAGQILSVTFTPDDTVSYNTVTTAVSITVNKATPTVTWSAPSAITYGTPLSASQLTAQSPVAGTFAYTPVAGTVLNAGATQTLSVTFTPTDTNNYNTATRTTTLTVDKATPVVTWNGPAAIIYGTALSSTQLNASGSVAGTFAYTPSAGTVLNAGASQVLSVIFTPTDTNNYTPATASTTINVGKATPIIAWNTPATITFGTPLGATQLNASTGPAGTFTYLPAGGTVLNAGPNQPLAVTFTPADTTNYNPAAGGTTISVNKATPTIVWNAPVAITFGTALSGTQLNASTAIAGSFVFTPPAGTVLNAGANQTLSAAFTPTDGANYNPTIVTTTLTVNQVTPTISWTAPADIVYPAALGSTQLNATASVPGTLAYIPAAGTVLEPGTARPLAVTFTPNDAVNYTNAIGGTTINVAKATVTVALTDLTHTYNGSPKGAGGTTSPVAGLTLSFSYATGPAGTAPVNVGSYAVTATVVDPRYQGFANGTISINKADQVIDFATLPSKPFNDPNFGLTAVSRRVGDNQPTGLTISYASSDTTKAEIVSGNMVDLKQQGSTTITASQTGDANYNAATSVPQTLLVEAAGQTITFVGTELAGKTFGNGPITLVAESRANLDSTLTGLTVAFTSDNTAVATVSANTLTIVGAGTANITASQAGNPGFFAAATPVVRALTVAKKAATVTLGSLAQVYNNTPRAATAVTNPAGLTVAFTYTPTGGTPSATAPTAAGSYAVTATITGATPPESNYIGSDTKTLVIAKATQTITFADILSPKLVNAGSFNLTATSDATPTLPVTFTSSNPAVASIVGNVATIHALGTTTITAKQAGDTNYLPAVDAPQTLEVRPVAPVITSHPALAQTAVVGSPFIFGPVTLNALSAPTTFSISGAPAGLSVNPTTGIISGTPSGTPGSFNIVLTATNATSSDSKTIVLTLQPPAPVITSAAAVAVVAGNAIDYTVTTTPTLANGVTLSTSTLPAWLSFNAATGAFTGTPTVPESITVTVTATNATGAAVLPLQITVTPNPNAPIYTGTVTPSGSAGAAFSFATNFGTGVGTTTYVLTGPTGMVINATGVISWPTPLPGTHPVTVVATRGGLITTASLNVTINPAANAPIVTITGGNVRSATVGSVFGPVAMTATSLPTSFTIGTLPAGLTVGGTATAPTIGGTPTTPGTTNFAITATNSAGTGPTAILTITVAPHALAPVITSGPIVQGRVGEALTYTLTATPVLATTFGATGTLPPGTSLTSGVVSGSPTAAGSYTAFFAGTNTNGIGLALQVTFNIAPPLTVPVVTSNGSAPAQVGQAFSYAITATNGPTSFGATPLPAGLSLNAATGMITGVPSTATTATSPALVSLTATNGDGTSNPKTLQIAIAPAPAAPVVTSGATANGRVGLAFTYQITASGTPTSFVATGLPAGLSVAPATGAITGTPTVAGTFAATIAAANTSGLGANAPLTLTIAPALTAPAITSAATFAGQVGVALTYQIAASPGTISSYALTGTLPTGLALNTVTGAITGSPTVPGSVTVSLTATSDGGTSLPQPLTLQIAPAANVPVITSPGSATANAGAAFSYQITATPAATTLDAANLPSGLAVNPFTGLISGTPTTVGTTVAGLVGTNAAGTGPTRDLTVTVQPAATAPVVTGATSLSAQVGANFTHQMTATNGPTSFEVIGAPAWMTVNSATGVIAGTPTTPGSLTVFFLAGNSAGVSSPRIVTFTIAAAANTPLITSSHTAAGTVGAVFAGYTITATNTPTGYLALGLPPGLSLNPTTGAITGTPTSSGTYPVTVSAANANGVGGPITVTFTIARSVSFGL